MPSPSIDWLANDGVKEIPIEKRDGAELSHVSGKLPDGTVATVQIAPEHSPMANYGFDVTPAHLVTALVTERGICSASVEGLRGLFPDLADGKGKMHA